MKKFVGYLAAGLVGVSLFVAFAHAWLSQPFQVVDLRGTCLFEVHPNIVEGTEIREPCGTTGELGLAPSMPEYLYQK